MKRRLIISLLSVLALGAADVHFSHAFAGEENFYGPATKAVSSPQGWSGSGGIIIRMAFLDADKLFKNMLEGIASGLREGMEDCEQARKTGRAPKNRELCEELKKANQRCQKGEGLSQKDMEDCKELFGVDPPPHSTEPVIKKRPVVKKPPVIKEADCWSKNSDTAIEACSRIIESGRLNGKTISQNNLALMYYNRGIARQNLESFNNAIEDYTQAIAINPNHANSFYYRGTCFQNLGYRDRAIDDYKKAIEIDPSLRLARDQCGKPCSKR